MIRPIINNNGTDAFDLIQPRRDAMGLINELIDALKQVTPNGRDYICDRDRLIADRELHFDRLAALHTLREELLDEALYIQKEAA
jgi:hypothetical protein